MSDWFPGAIKDVGLNASYRRGVCTMQCVKEHFTVGTDSRALIRNKGLAQFLFPKVGPPIQFAEANAVCADSGEWNRTGPGLEFERMGWDVPLTADQIRWGGAVSLWLSVTYGIPLVHYGGPRIPLSAGFRGFINHGSLIQTEQHSDGITAADFQAMVGASPSPVSTQGSDPDMLQYRLTGNRFYRFFPNSPKFIAVGFDAGTDKHGNPTLDGRWSQAKAAGVPTIDGGGSGVGDLFLLADVKSALQAQGRKADADSVVAAVKS